jgi:hypothetical protein
MSITRSGSSSDGSVRDDKEFLGGETNVGTTSHLRARRGCFGAVLKRAGVATLEDRLLRRRNNGTLDDSEEEEDAEDDDDNATFVVVVDNDSVFDDATDGTLTGAWEPVAPHDVAFSNMAVRAKAISLKVS